MLGQAEEREGRSSSSSSSGTEINVTFMIILFLLLLLLARGVFVKGKRDGGRVAVRRKEKLWPPPFSPICRLIESLWDLLDQREWERSGHGHTRHRIGLGHLKT